MKIKERNIVRDFLAYTYFSMKRLLFKGEFSHFFSDMGSFFKWRESRSKSFEKWEELLPWMNFKAVAYLEKLVRKEMIVYEYGSGISTFFLAQKVKQVISVEHDADWFEEVKKVSRKKETQNIQLQIFLPEPSINGELINCGDPHQYQSCVKEYRGLNFENYVKSIEAFPDDSFDVVIVDGRARPSCILHAIKKVKENGILIVDNSDRSYYLQPFYELKDERKWTAKTFRGHVPYSSTVIIDSTTFFKKNKINT